MPDGIRAQFADTRSEERSNFRKGQHGLARPAEEPVVEKLAKIASTDAGAADGDADASAAATTTLDGGAP